MKKVAISFGFLFIFSLGLLVGFWFGESFYQKPKENLVSNFVTDQREEKLKPPQIVLLAGGDIMLGRKVGYTMTKTRNFNWPFEKLADVIKSADFSFFNLESPFFRSCKPTETGMVFCADFNAIDGLLFAGVDGVNLSNNHIRNYGDEGLEDTRNLLKENKIGFFGEGENPLIVDVKGMRFAFLGYNEVGLGEKAYRSLKNQLREEVLNTRPLVDILIVSFHWGNEYTTTISPRQRELSYLAIDAGGDVVIGHHPHWVQEKEIYKGKPIYYSLGNFVFDQMWSEETRKGILVKLVFEGKNLIDEEILPFKIFDFGQPRFEE